MSILEDPTVVQLEGNIFHPSRATLDPSSPGLFLQTNSLSLISLSLSLSVVQTIRAGEVREKFSSFESFSDVFILRRRRGWLISLSLSLVVRLLDEDQWWERCRHRADEEIASTDAAERVTSTTRSSEREEIIVLRPRMSPKANFVGENFSMSLVSSAIDRDVVASAGILLHFHADGILPRSSRPFLWSRRRSVFVFAREERCSPVLVGIVLRRERTSRRCSEDSREVHCTEEEVRCIPRSVEPKSCLDSPRKWKEHSPTEHRSTSPTSPTLNKRTNDEPFSASEETLLHSRRVFQRIWTNAGFRHFSRDRRGRRTTGTSSDALGIVDFPRERCVND